MTGNWNRAYTHCVVQSKCQEGMPVNDMKRTWRLKLMMAKDKESARHIIIQRIQANGQTSSKAKVRRS